VERGLERLLVAGAGVGGPGDGVDVGGPGGHGGLVQLGYGVGGDLVALGGAAGRDRVRLGELAAGDGDADLHGAVLDLGGVTRDRTGLPATPVLPGPGRRLRGLVEGGLEGLLVAGAGVGRPGHAVDVRALRRHGGLVQLGYGVGGDLV